MSEEHAGIHLHPMEIRHIPELAEMATKAFENDPGFAWMFDNEETRCENLKWLCERMIWVSLQHQENYILKAGNKLVGMICPKYSTESDSIWAELRSGFIKFPFVAGYESFIRALAISKVHKDFYQSISGHFVMLEHIAIDVNYQGRGLGKKMIKQITEKYETLGLSCYLGTQNPANLKFYDKCGFKVLKEVQVAESGPVVYMMGKDDKQ